MISRVLLKIKQKCAPLLILTAPVWSEETSAATPGKRNSDKPKKYCPPTDGEEFIDTSRLFGFRKTL